MYKRQRKDSVEAANAVRRRAQTAALQTGGTTQIEVLPNQSAADIETVSKSVENIVNSTLQLQFGRELCTTILTKPSIVSAASPGGAGTASPSTSAQTACLKYLDQTSAALASDIVTNEALKTKLIEIIDADNFESVFNRLQALDQGNNFAVFAGIPPVQSGSNAIGPLIFELPKADP